MASTAMARAELSAPCARKESIRLRLEGKHAPGAVEISHWLCVGRTAVQAVRRVALADAVAVTQDGTCQKVRYQSSARVRVKLLVYLAQLDGIVLRSVTPPLMVRLTPMMIQRIRTMKTHVIVLVCAPRATTVPAAQVLRRRVNVVAVATFVPQVRASHSTWSAMEATQLGA